MKMNIEKVAVLGAGIMGRQIALLIAKFGFEVYCYSQTEETINNAKEYVGLWIVRHLENGKISEEESISINNKLHFSNDLSYVCVNADLVVETIIENIEAKRSILQAADKLTSPNTVFATNSSYIVNSELRDSLSNPSQIVNMHFFNPAMVMSVVEVVKGELSSDEAFNTVCDFAEKIGKTPIKIEKEIYGFVVNRIFSALTKEACFLIDQKIASAKDIDAAVKGALGHPMGPLETLDMTGIDLEYRVYMDRYAKTGNESDKPAKCLVDKYLKGEYGRKTGKGFYEYR